MDRTVLVVGLILIVTGFIIYLAYNPTLISLVKRMYGFDNDTITESDFEFYITLTSFIIPITTVLISIGATLILLGAFKGKKKDT